MNGSMGWGLGHNQFLGSTDFHLNMKWHTELAFVAEVSQTRTRLQLFSSPKTNIKLIISANEIQTVSPSLYFYMSRNTICRSNKSYCPSDLTNRDESPIAKLADFLPHIYKSNFSSLIFFILNNIRYCKLFSFGFGYFHVLTTVRRTFKQLYLRVNRSCRYLCICLFVSTDYMVVPR